MSETEKKKHKGWKHWLMFGLRWGIAVVGVWWVVAHMSIRDQAWVILNHATNRPVQVSLESSVGENAATYPVIVPSTGNVVDVPREFVVNEPDQKTVTRLQAGSRKQVQLLGLDLAGDINHTARVMRLLVADSLTANAVWVAPNEVSDYEMKIPHPRDEVGLKSMVHNARPLLLWLSILVLPITFIFTSYRWHELLKALDIHIGIGRAFVLNMVGCFYNSFMPGSTGGDLLKAYYASKQTTHRMRAVISVIVDRAVGLIALIFIGGIMAGLQWDIPACQKIAVAAICICAAVLLGLLVFYNPTLHRISGLDFVLKKLPMQKHVQSAVHAMHMYGKRPFLGLWALIVTIPVHASVITSAMFAGMAFGLPLHWAYYWVCVPVIVLAGSIPISPQGAGVMEAFAILLTRRQGVSVSQAFALAMSIRLVQIIWNLTGGIFVLRGGFHAPTETETKELETDDEDDET
jgi:glycosyltransferase 2 family protein